MRIFLPVFAALALQFGNTFGNTADAVGFDLSLSNETVNFEVFTPLNRFLNRGAQLSLGAFYNELDDAVGTLKLFAVGTQSNTRVPYRLSVGGKGYIGEVSEAEADVGAIAIGGAIEIHYGLGNNPIDLTIEGFFTPGITTFGDTESVIEINARVAIEIVPQVKAFIGFRNFEVEDDSNTTLELDDNIHFGVRLQF